MTDHRQSGPDIFFDALNLTTDDESTNRESGADDPVETETTETEELELSLDDEESEEELSFHGEEDEEPCDNSFIPCDNDKTVCSRCGFDLAEHCIDKEQP